MQPLHLVTQPLNLKTCSTHVTGLRRKRRRWHTRHSVERIKAAPDCKSVFGLWEQHSLLRSLAAALPRGLLFYFYNPRPERRKPHVIRGAQGVSPLKQGKTSRHGMLQTSRGHLRIACTRQPTALIARRLQVHQLDPQRLMVGQHAARSPWTRRRHPRAWRWHPTLQGR